MTHPIVNIADLDYQVWGHNGPKMGAKQPDETYQARRGAISTKIGAQKLGYNVTILPPGKRAFPRHNHRVNEEMFFIVEGVGEVRIGDARYPVKTGDVIACPPAGPETAHQIVNTSPNAELKYLSVSTMLDPEVVEYPDSGKVGVMAGSPPGANAKPATVRFLARAGESLDYWEGE